MGYKAQLKRMSVPLMNDIDSIKLEAPALVRRAAEYGWIRFPTGPDPVDDRPEPRPKNLTALEKAVADAERAGKPVNRELWKLIQTKISQSGQT